MTKILRILSVAFNQKKQGVLRFKIVYYRDHYIGYELENGDELDVAIKNYFVEKNPTQCLWEYYGAFNANIPTIHFAGFCPKNIPLIISASILDLTDREKETLVEKGTIFPNIDKHVTLFYRCNLSEEDFNWKLLPTEIRLAINHTKYNDLSQKIHLYP
ncbi:MAG: hypothetical protein JNM51_01770 [Bacteroidia bacterium]|nr:hypothetical protein [Bacteroidia bacterium]